MSVWFGLIIPLLPPPPTMRQTADSYVGLVWVNYSTPFPLNHKADSRQLCRFGSVRLVDSRQLCRFGLVKLAPFLPSMATVQPLPARGRLQPKMACFGFTPLSTVSRPGRQLTCKFGFWFCFPFPSFFLACTI